MSSHFGGSALVYFVRTAEMGQISRAAVSLNIAQPALSAAILKLERNVGVTLFVRHPRGVSLTPAGARLYEKAKAAVCAEEEALVTAQALARSGRGKIEVGFLGVLPQLLAPNMLERFAELRPDAGVTLRELRFPTIRTADWVARVDVALCFSPMEEGDVQVRVLREEPRCVLMHRGHRLAGRQQLRVEDVIDEEFCGLHPSVEPEWAGLWSLDDHRGAPAPRVTGDGASSYLEMVAAAASTRCISVVPMGVARSIAGGTGHLVVAPIADAAPVACALAWRTLGESALTAALGEMAAEDRDEAVPVAA